MTVYRFFGIQKCSC